MRIGILVSHPIQYFAPLFRFLAQRIDLHVFYATKASPGQQAKAGFGVEFDWDVDLLSGYPHSFLTNVSANPGPNSFRGCDTPEIATAIERGNYDAFVVFGWYLKAHWQAVRACRRFGVPVLVRGDSQLQTPRSALKKWVKRVSHTLALRQFDGYLAVGKRNREYLLHYGAPADRIFLSPHFVDNQWFAERAAAARLNRAETRARWHATDETLVVIFVGKFIPKKRPADVLNAITLAAKKGRDVVGVFVGAGELEPELRGLAAAGNIQVAFEGFRNQTELPAYYASSDVLVLPSDGAETWGLVVNEGMACGLPAILSDAVGCAPDLIDEGETGFTFPFRDVGALAERIEQLAELRQSGFDFAAPLEAKLARYSVEAAAKGVVEATEKLSQQQSAGAR